MSLRFFVFGSRTVLPDHDNSGIMAASMYRSVNAFLNAFCAKNEFLTSKVLNAIYSWCCPVFFFRNFFFHILVSDGKSTHKICYFAHFNFHLFHPQHNWILLILLPDTSPKLNKSLHLGHSTFALFHCFQSPSWNMMLCFFQLGFSMYFFNFTFL